MRYLTPLLLLAAVQVAPAAELPRPISLPSGFVDPTGQIGIFNTPGGGIQAVELGSGRSFWQTDQAQRPLFAGGNRLFALAAVRAPVARCFGFEWQLPWDGPSNGFRLVAFDLSQFGQVVLESEIIALPEWASIVEGHDRSFAIRWHIEDGRLVVDWNAKAWYAGSLFKTPQEEDAFRQLAAGAVSFDLATGDSAPRPVQPPAGPQPMFAGWQELERLAIRWRKTTPNRHFALTLEQGPGTQTLNLHTLNLQTGQMLGVIALMSGQRLTALPTIDEEYLCLRDQSPSPDVQAKLQDQPVQWTIFKVDGGQCIAEVPFEPGTTTAAIHGARAYFLVSQRINGSMNGPFIVPRSLRAVDLKTGMTLWERPVGGKPSAPPPLQAWPKKPAACGLAGAER